MSGTVIVGEVPVFDPLPDERETARKLTEESAEVFGALSQYRKAYKRVIDYAGSASTDGLRDASDELVFAEEDLRGEIADVVQVVANLCAIVGVHDLRPDVERCRKRNEERGRAYGHLC